MEAFLVYILEFIKTDVFIPFGLMTVPLIVLRNIKALKGKGRRFDNAAGKLIVFSGLTYTIILLIVVTYSYFTEDPLEHRATGPYAIAYWLMLFSWLLITQPFRFRLVRKNSVIRLFSIPFFLITFEQFVIITTTIHRDYLPGDWDSITLWDALNEIPFWYAHLFLKLGFFTLYVLLFQWLRDKWLQFDIFKTSVTRVSE